MRALQWAGLGLGAVALLAFLGSAFDPARAEDDAFYGAAAPVLLGIGALALLRSKRASVSRGVGFLLTASVVVLAFGLAIVGSQLPGRLASTYVGTGPVALVGDINQSDYETDSGALTSDKYKETTLLVRLHWTDDGRYQPDLTATVPTPSGEVDCASNDFRQWVRGTGIGEADTMELNCDSYIPPSDFATVGAVTLTEKQS